MTRFGITLTTSLLLAAPAAAGEIFFLGNYPYTYLTDIDDGGRVAVGSSPGAVFYWTRETRFQVLDQAKPYGNGVGGETDITADGTTQTCSTLQGDLPQKTRGTRYDRASNTYFPMPAYGSNCDIEQYGNWGLSRDGQHVCGLSWYSFCAAQGFAWDKSTGSISLMDTKYAYKPTRANGISDDGSVIAGWNDDYNGWRQGACWKRNANGVYVPQLIAIGPVTNKTREAQCCSGDGRFIYGSGRSDHLSGAPYRYGWTTGYEDIVPTPENGGGFVHRANVDGSILLVTFGGSYLWIKDRGYVTLQQWSSEHGFDIPPEYSGLVAMCMSRDSLAFAGIAFPADGTWQLFVLDLHPPVAPCKSDLNGDRKVDGADLGILLGDWGLQFSHADINGDGAVDGADLGILLGDWGNCGSS